MTHPWFMVVMLVIVVAHSWARLLFASFLWKHTWCLLIPTKLVLREEVLTLRLCKNVVRKHSSTYLPKISLWYLSLCLSIYMLFKWTFPILTDNIPFKSQRPSNKTPNTSFEKAAFEFLIRVVQERTKHGAFCYCLDCPQEVESEFLLLKTPSTSDLESRGPWVGPELYFFILAPVHIAHIWHCRVLLSFTLFVLLVEILNDGNFDKAPLACLLGECLFHPYRAASFEIKGK